MGKTRSGGHHSQHGAFISPQVLGDAVSGGNGQGFVWGNVDGVIQDCFPTRRSPDFRGPEGGIWPVGRDDGSLRRREAFPFVRLPDWIIEQVEGGSAGWWKCKLNDFV